MAATQLSLRLCQRLRGPGGEAEVRRCVYTSHCLQLRPNY